MRPEGSRYRTCEVLSLDLLIQCVWPKKRKNNNIHIICVCVNILYIYLFIYWFIYLFIYIFIHVFIYLCVCLFVGVCVCCICTGLNTMTSGRHLAMFGMIPWKTHYFAWSACEVSKLFHPQLWMHAPLPHGSFVIAMFIARVSWQCQISI